MLCSIRMFSRCGLRSKMWPMWVRNSSSLEVVKETFPAKANSKCCDEVVCGDEEGRLRLSECRQRMSELRQDISECRQREAYWRQGEAQWKGLTGLRYYSTGKECTTSKDDMPQKLREKAFEAISSVIIASSNPSVHMIMDKWVEEGNVITFHKIFYNMILLRRRGMAVEALHLSEWYESSHKYAEFSDEYYAAKVDLIARVRGVFEAEIYFVNTVAAHGSSKAGNVLLEHFVRSNIIGKSVDIFRQIPFSTGAFNLLMLLFLRTSDQSILGALSSRLKDDGEVHRSLFSYQLAIDDAGAVRDIPEMERVLENMLDHGVDPTPQIRASLSRYYAAAGSIYVSNTVEGDLRDARRID